MQRLTLDHLTVHNERGVVVGDVCLSVEPNTALGIIGPNGCGKTSILRSIQGFLPVRGRGAVPPCWSWGGERRWMTGRILIDEQEVTSKRPGERNLGLVPQNLALFPDKTVLGNIMFPLLARGISTNEARSQASTLAGLLELEAILDRKPGEISGGQQQRVAIARALIGGPKLVLLDEPLASLDGGSRRDVLLLLKSVINRLGESAIYVTHDPDEAGLLCDSVAFVHGGKLQQLASPAEAYEAPRTLWIARAFSGFGNIVKGDIRNNMFFLERGDGFSREGDRCAIRLSGCFPEMEGAILAARNCAFQPVDTNECLRGVIESTYLENGVPCTRVSVGTDKYLTVAGNIGSRNKTIKLALAPDGANHIRIFDREGKAMAEGGLYREVTEYNQCFRCDGAHSE